MFKLGWLRQAPRSRAVQITDGGCDGLARAFGIELAAQREH
jgi:phage shock protein PspC (stress-responsive transcriptional regulator)